MTRPNCWTGSGEVLIMTRLPALSAWLPAATEAPVRAAASPTAWAQITHGSRRQSSSCRDANKGMQGVPARINPRCFVSEKTQRST